MHILLLSASIAIAAKKPLPEPDLHDMAGTLLGRALASDTTWTRLTELCDDIGPRLAGSDGLNRAIAWGAAAMAEDGLAARLEPVTVPVWIRGAERASLLGPVPRELPILGLGGSVGTQPGGIDADVVVVHSFDELAALGKAGIEGRIVLYDVPFTTYGETVGYRWGGASAAAKHGAVAVLVRSVTPESLATPHTGAMGYDPAAPKIPAAAVTTEDSAAIARMAGKGTVRVHLEMSAKAAPDAPSANVVGEIRGREKPDEIVVLGCHLGSWDVGQGAQDDGAGCVMVMEAGRLIASLPVPPRRTVRVVLYTNEESGLAGGKAYAAAHAMERHVAALEADTGAGRPLGFRIQGGADDEKPADLDAFAELAGLLGPLRADTLENGGAGADIGPLVATQGIGLGLINDMEPYWRIHHTAADTLDKIDPLVLRENAATVTLAAWWLAETPVVPARTP